MTHDYSQQSTVEDPRMMAFFDSLVQREIEGWSSEGITSTPHSPSDNNSDTNQSDDTDSEGKFLYKTSILTSPGYRVLYKIVFQKINCFILTIVMSI